MCMCVCVCAMCATSGFVLPASASAELAVVLIMGWS